MGIPIEAKPRGKIGTEPIDDYLSDQVADPKIAARAKQKYTEQDVKAAWADFRANQTL